MDQRSWDDLPAEVAGRASSAGLTIGGAVTACLSLIRDYLADPSVGEVQHA